jgi:hemoglobin
MCHSQIPIWVAASARRSRAFASSVASARALLVLALVGGCWTGPIAEPRAAEPRPAERPSLYTRVGGREALRAIVDELLDSLETDGRVDMYFMDANGTAIRRHLTDWLCVASRGPCRYTGRHLGDTHAELAITGLDFDVFVSVFKDVLDRRGIRGRERTELVLILRRARAEIVERSR